MIRYEDMPPSAQKAYRFTNTARKVLAILTCPFVVIFFLLGILSGEGFVMGLLLTTNAAFLLGIFHGEFIYKSLLRKLSVIGILPAMFVAGIFSGIGLVFWIIDLVFIIQKKPLIFQFEHGFLLESKAARQEMAQMAYNQYVYNVSRNNAYSGLQQLKNMLDQGIITREEFEMKKAELLRRI